MEDAVPGAEDGGADAEAAPADDDGNHDEEAATETAEDPRLGDDDVSPEEGDEVATREVEAEDAALVDVTAPTDDAGTDVFVVDHDEESTGSAPPSGAFRGFRPHVPSTQVRPTSQSPSPAQWNPTAWRRQPAPAGSARPAITTTRICQNPQRSTQHPACPLHPPSDRSASAGSTTTLTRAGPEDVRWCGRVSTCPMTQCATASVSAAEPKHQVVLGTWRPHNTASWCSPAGEFCAAKESPCACALCLLCLASSLPPAVLPGLLTTTIAVPVGEHRRPPWAVRCRPHPAAPAAARPRQAAARRVAARRLPPPPMTVPPPPPPKRSLDPPPPGPPRL